MVNQKIGVAKQMIQESYYNFSDFGNLISSDSKNIYFFQEAETQTNSLR